MLHYSKALMCPDKIRLNVLTHFDLTIDRVIFKVMKNNL
jgi:hypothetical protein